MKSDNIEVPKSDEETPFIQRCIKLVDFLSKVLDKEYEIVLFSFRQNREDGEIIALRNGYISGRKLGDGMLSEGKHAFSSHAFRYSNSVINYAVSATNGNHLACSALILGEDLEHPDGILSINRVVASDYMFASAVDPVSELKQLYEPFLSGARKSDVAAAVAEQLSGAAGKVPVASYEEEAVVPMNISLRDKLASALAQVTGITGKDPTTLSVEERILVINVLKKQGVFQMRNAVNIAADFFKLSEPTIYRYLQKAV